MTNGERRRARKTARAAGESFSGELALDRGGPEAGPQEFTETTRGRRARYRWARRYDSLNGAPEGAWDR